MNFSVICPTYNSSKFIEKTLKTILYQSYNKFEVIFSDDGSDDNTLEIINSYKKNFEDRNIEIKIIAGKHKGTGHARNIGMQLSKYDWIAFIDSDDLWEEKKLEKVNKILIEYNNFNCVLHRQYFKNRFGKIKFHNYDKYFNEKKSVFIQLFKSNFIATSSLVIKKQLILHHNGFDESLQNAQDYDLWLKIGDEFNIYIIKDYLGTYVERANNITSSPYSKRFKNLFKIICKYQYRVNKFLFVYKLLRLLISNQWLK